MKIIQIFEEYWALGMSVMSFGLRYEPDLLVRLTSMVLRDMNFKTCKMRLDDVIVMGFESIWCCI